MHEYEFWNKIGEPHVDLFHHHRDLAAECPWFEVWTRVVFVYFFSLWCLRDMYSQDCGSVFAGQVTEESCIWDAEVELITLTPFWT